MAEYLVRLLLAIPVIAGLAWASLWLWRRAQAMPGLGSPAARHAKILDVLVMGANAKLVVVAFGGRKLLVASSGQGISLIAEHFGDD